MRHKRTIPQICFQCGIEQPEGWPTHYSRVVAARNPKPFYCRDCKRIKFLIDNPEIVRQRDEARERKLYLKSIAKNFKARCTTDENIRNSIQKQKEESSQKRTKYMRQYLASERGRAIYRDSMAKRRAKIMGALIELSAEEKKAIREFYKGCPDGFHVDHIIPISKGGKHCRENLQYLPAQDNLRKRNKIDLKILSGMLENGMKINVSWLMCKFKLDVIQAKEIMEHIEETYV